MSPTAAWRLRHPKRRMLQDARRRATRNGVPFSLTEDDITIPARCPVLGIELVQSRGRASPASPSLDRIRPEDGYVPGNVVVISNRANQLRSDATSVELQCVVAYCKEIE